MADRPEVQLDYQSLTIGGASPKLKVSCMWPGGPPVKKWTLFLGSENGRWDIAIINDCQGKVEWVDLEDLDLQGVTVYAQVAAKIDGEGKDKDGNKVKMDERILSEVASKNISP